MSDYDFADHLVPYSFFQSVIDLLPVAVDIINEEKASVLSNEQFRKMFSWNDAYPFYQEIEQVFSSKKSVNTYNYQVTTLPGNDNSIHLIIEPLFDQSEVIGAIVIARDITQIISYQEEIAQMEKMVEQLKNQLAKAMDTTNKEGFTNKEGVSSAQKHSSFADDLNHELKELQAVVDYTSRDNATWMALRDLRNNLRNRIPTYVYGEFGVDKREIITQMIKKGFQQDVYWIEVTKQNQIKDAIQHLEKNLIYTGVVIKEEKILKYFLAAIKEKSKISTIDKKGHCKWIVVGRDPVENIKNFHSIRIPPLRERKGDILLLVEKLLPKGISIDEEVKRKFIQYDWPQNIRQLRGVLSYAITMRDPKDKKITLAQLPEIFNGKRGKADLNTNLEIEEMLEGLLKAIDNSKESMPEIFDRIEKKYIEQVLQQQLYNITHTANKLGIKRQALQYKLKKYNLLLEDQSGETQ